MESFEQRQVRCAACNRRLADIVSEIESGQVIFELKCPRCGHPHLEILRAARAGQTEVRSEGRTPIARPSQERRVESGEPQ